MTNALLWIGAGGALGSAARYALAAWIARGGHVLPLGTLLVNALGSLLLASLATATDRLDAVSPGLRLGLTVGLMGGFTTYSTFNLETMRMLQSGHAKHALLNVLLTLVVCAACGAIGWYAGKALFARG